MCHEAPLAEEFFAKLLDLDEKIARQVKVAGCQRCGGPLHRADYVRKPRGAAIAAAGEAFSLRHSLCCGSRRCRRRTLPPSLRFLGRRVYLEAVVLIAATLALVMPELRTVREVTRVPVRTLRRWGKWWQVTSRARRLG